MSIFVIAEHDNAALKPATLSAVTAAVACLLYTSDAADE